MQAAPKRKIYNETLNQVISSFSKNNLTLDSMTESDLQELIDKVIQDINFLKDRIIRLKSSNHFGCNPIVLKTYEGMLESRKSILSWLQSEDFSLNELASKTA